MLAAVFLGLMTLLSGCGGGGVASNTAEPLVVLPGTATLYYGYPTVFTISGGRKNYTVYSSDSAILPVSSNVADNTFVASASNVATDTEVTLTVRDSDGKQATVAVTVKPATLVGTSITVTPEADSGMGCAPAVCSGGYGLVSVRLLQFSGVSNHSLRFEVMHGDFEFVDGATTRASIDVTTDQIGYALARIKAKTDAPTQFALLKVTDLVNGSSQQTSFTIAQYTSGTGILSVVPETHTIQAYWKGECSSGVKVDYLIHGGTPPYTVQSTSTGVATVYPNTVLTNGAGFTATTKNGFCPGTATIDIKDATGRVIQATLENKEGTETVTLPTPAAFFTTAPADVTVAAGSSANFVIGGGATPYYASSSDTTVATATIASSILTITGVASGTATITVMDSAGASKTIKVTVTGGTTGGTSPTVLWTIPSSNQTNVSTTASALAKFSTSMDPLTLTSGSILARNVTDNSVIQVNSITQNTPDTYTVNICDSNYYSTCGSGSALWAGKTYEITFTNSIRSSAGVQLTSYTFSFTTGGGTTDTTPPTVVYTIPNNGATAVDAGSPMITIKFSEAMDSNTVNNAAITYVGGTTPPTGFTVSRVADDLYTLSSPTLLANTTYTVTISNSVRDKAGNFMVSPYAFSFTTSTVGP